MDFISNFAGKAGIPIILFATFVLIFLAILARKGMISFEGKGIRVGDTISNSSRIKQLQWSILIARSDIALNSLPKEYLEEPKKWRTHYVVGKYRDVLQLAILQNNIIDEATYIESKQLLAYAAILKATDDDYFRTDEFRKQLYEEVRNTIKDFCKVKEKYEE